MAKVQTRRIRPIILQADQQALSALQAIPNYTPTNPGLTTEAVNATYLKMQEAKTLEVQAIAAAAAARDAANAAEWEFHNAILGVKDQVIALYGKDSSQLQSLGLKKASEYKTPRPRPTTP